MAQVFVSHASADATYVEKFVDNVLRIGCGLDGSNMFYSSERDTGVPSGADLMATIRKEVGDATLVIAIITPTYQTRPVCVAELGAAWALSGKLFPLLAPETNRDGLQGIIPSVLAQRLDDTDALDELLDRVKEATGSDIPTPQWGAGKRKWLTWLQSGNAILDVPRIPTEAEHEALKKDLQETAEALTLTERQLDQSEAKYRALAEAKDAAEVRTILLPEDTVERFRLLLKETRALVQPLPSVVQEALFQALRGNLFAYPNRYQDPQGADEMDDAIDRKLVVEEDEYLYSPNLDKLKVASAHEAIERLGKLIRPENSGETFCEWFEVEYGVEPDLSDKDCWEALLG
jgi:hypothetical protein